MYVGISVKSIVGLCDWNHIVRNDLHPTCFVKKKKKSFILFGYYQPNQLNAKQNHNGPLTSRATHLSGAAASKLYEAVRDFS